MLLPIWEGTFWNTLERNNTSAINATTLQFIQAIWRSTKGPTLGKSLIDAQCASFQALQLMLWKFTWWVSIQEQNNSSVTSATTLAPLLVTCRTTWRRTQGRSLSSATNAVKLTSTNKSSQNIHNSTWPQIRLEPMQRTWRFTAGRSLSQQILRTKEQSCKTFKNSHNLDSDC